MVTIGVIEAESPIVQKVFNIYNSIANSSGHK